MRLAEVIKGMSPNSKVEHMIVDTFEEAKNPAQFYQMTSDYILNALNLSKKDPQESAVIMKTLFEQKKESFAQVTALSYYIASLEFWSYLSAKENQNAGLDEVIVDVNREVARCKDLIGAYLVQAINEEAFDRQVSIVCFNFSITEKFHNALLTCFMQEKAEIIDELVLKLVN